MSKKMSKKKSKKNFNKLLSLGNKLINLLIIVSKNEYVQSIIENLTDYL